MGFDPLARRRVGRTAVEVTVLGLGGAPLGDLFALGEEETARATVRTALEAGIGYIDTAPWYGLGKSEHRIGSVLAALPAGRVVVSTKVGRILRRPRALPFRPERWVGGRPFEVVFDYGYDGVMRAYEDSLQRLALPRVDMLLVHDLDEGYFPDPAVLEGHFRALEGGGLRALEELKRTGEIRAFGAGVNLPGTIGRWLDRGLPADLFLVAMPYTLLDQPALEAELPRCAEAGIGIVIGAVFASGILATGARPGALWRYRPAPPEVLERAARIEAVCARHGVEPRAAALQFPLHHPLVAAVIPGADRPAIVTENLRLLAAPIPAALWAELKAEGLLHAAAPVPG